MKNAFQGKYVIITGASLGLGKAIAEKLAAKGCNLILLSLPNENLSHCCEDIATKYGIDTLYYEMDLREEDNIREFAEWVMAQEVEIAGLVNNAGIGGSSFFDRTDVMNIDNMILINIRALTLMTRLFVPELKKREKAFVLNVSSIAAFKPMPYKTVYPASKAFVYSFSVGLGEELKDSPVHVAVLHPGPMDTSAENAGRISKHGFLGKLVHLSVDEVAGIGVQQLFAGKKVIVPGVFNKLCIRLLKSIPRDLAMPILTKVLKKEAYKIPHKSLSPVTQTQHIHPAQRKAANS
ncbi:MAG TPA: SDR family NAD(P)-dependent oxidoreductase [Cyclobacteriaceae bacterium]|nr:SDR family NAD(P)-dependent oxidoreductase [Cyclobacteriaceae bacterium]